MKYLIALLMITALVCSLFAQENWKAYTNTSYIFSIDKMNSKIVSATWGGIHNFDLSASNNISSDGKTLTILDGLTENFIRDVKFDSTSQMLYIATKSTGVNRLQNGKMLMPITDLIGLVSNKVNKVEPADSLVIIATDSGVSVFYNDPQNSFPILIKNLTSSNVLSADNITSIKLYKNYLLCGSASGLDFASLDSLTIDSAWHHYNHDNSPLLSDKINDISTSDNAIAIATRSGVNYLTDLFNFQQWKTFDEGYTIFPILLYDNKLIYSYGYWNEDTYTIDESDSADFVYSEVSNPSSSMPPVNHVSDTSITPQIMDFKFIDGMLLSATWGRGLYLYNESDWENYMPNCPAANSIFKVVLDNDKNLWLTSGYHGALPTPTGTKGVSRFDGSTWTNFSTSNSDLGSDNIDCIAVDSYNDVLMGTRYASQGNAQGWINGLYVYGQNDETWSYKSVWDNFLIDIYIQDEDNKWFTFYDAGVMILDKDNNEKYRFTIYSSPDQKVVKTLPAMDKVFFGFWFDGIKYWDDSSLPDPTNISKWVTPNASELTQGKIYDIAYRKSEFEDQVWFASSMGLFMFNGENWYWYGPIQKKRILASSNNWEPDDLGETEYHTPEFWYVVGQERLYGSVATFPTALFVDPFGSIWIGTADHGITRFYPEKDIYINYYTENSPLLSNKINDFAYNDDTGELYIATDNGLNSVYIGISPENNKETKLNKTLAYPNPFYPEKNQILQIKNLDKKTMPKGETKCGIYNLNGDLIITLTKNDYQRFEWDGKNKSGKSCAAGIYFYIVYTPDKQIDKNKFVLIR